jgi:type II secretory ATPase GspE/PulE/Tfp pilus assembly ATPase PilB-like protein/ActR/RegA family two-component response regulator
MLVEDNLIYRELIRELCEMDGHGVVEASSAEGALEMLKTFAQADVFHQRRRIDLFIIDFNMDIMNGYEFIREIRMNEEMRNVPVLMVSSTAKAMEDLLKIEGVEFLRKPCTNAALMTSVRRLLGLTAPTPMKPVSAPPPPAAVQAPPVKAAPRDPPAPTSLPPAKAPLAPVKAPAPIVKQSLPAAKPAATVAKAPTPSPPAAKPAPLPVIKPAPAPAAKPTPAPAAKPAPVPAAKPVPVVAAKPALASVVKAAPASVARPAAVPAPKAPPPAPSGELLEDGLRNDIAQSKELSELLDGRRKLPVVTEAMAASAASPVADLIDKLLESAVRQRASDIHLEPQSGALDVRFRVDGALQPVLRLPSGVAENLVARVKILCNLNITEKRLPQDGQFLRQRADGRGTKFRVSTLPSIHGEKVVLRVLPAENLRPDLESVGFSSEELALVRQVLRTPNGLVLVTGPTGSGKSSTLYTMLESLNTRQRNIVTVEDPVEYQLEGITQVQVNAAIGYTFEKILRSFLRQDPDVMLVGEIRDAETAEIALKAAVTGHLVLSTLHTNDAASAVQRMLAMGIPSYLVAAATRLVIAQRLVRALCGKCKTPAALSPQEACLIAPEEARLLARIYRPVGCPECHGIGYFGRRVVLEMMPVLSPEMRSALAAGAAADVLKQMAAKEGMVPMRRKALKLVADGITSLDDALTALYV